MKKILFTASDNNIQSGAFRSMVKLCEILREKFDCLPVVLLCCDGDGETLLNEAKIPFFKIKSFSWIVPRDFNWTILRRAKKFVKIMLNEFAALKIARLIKTQKIDIVHANTTYTYVGAKAAKLAKVPLVWHLREFLEEDQNNKIWDKKGLKLIASSDRIIAISKSLHDKYKNIFPAEKFKIVYNGISLKDFFIERKIFTQKEIRILCVGNMCGSKGQDNIIKACGGLVKKGIKNFRVSFVGSGPKESEYKELVNQMNLSDYFVFWGGGA